MLAGESGRTEAEAKACQAISFPVTAAQSSALLMDARMVTA